MPVSIVTIVGRLAENEPLISENSHATSESTVPYFLFELELITNDLCSAVGTGLREQVREDRD